jgi:hypothetical protein
MNVSNKSSGVSDRRIHQEALERLGQIVVRRRLPPADRRAFVLMTAASEFSTRPTQPLRRCGA